MTPADKERAAVVAKGLTEIQRCDLTERWDQFCDCDVLSGNRDHGEYTSDLLLDGFADIRPVEPEDFEDPFAFERGIEPDGLVYVLTPLGQAVREHLQEHHHG